MMDLGHFKKFMRLRDMTLLFDEVKAKGGLGYLVGTRAMIRCMRPFSGTMIMVW